MVARTPQRQRNVVAPLNPALIRETVQKVDKCMARLQELQYTVTGGSKVVSGVSLSPRSTKTYLKTSLRCKQESLRIKGSATKKSPVGKFPASSAAGGDWKRISLPAMLLGETVGEILHASQFAREIVQTIATTHQKAATQEDPKTPENQHKPQRSKPETTDIKARRKREKQTKLQLIRSESDSPTLQRARSKINFRVVSPVKNVKERMVQKESYSANKVSPKRRPWAKKAVLFPNPLFVSTPSMQQARFCRTKSPVIANHNNNSKNKDDVKKTPHKFLIKSPPSASKFQIKIKSPPKISMSPTRQGNLCRKSPKSSAIISPTRQGNLSRKSPRSSAIVISPTRPGRTLIKKSPTRLSTGSKLRRSFSPSRLASRLVSPLKSSRLVSPLKSRKNVQKNNECVMISGLKQRPVSVPKRLSTGRMMEP